MMILSFDYVDTVGTGHSPQVLHMMDNGFEVVYVDSDGLVKSMVSYPSMGLYDELTWKEKGRMSPDENISYSSLKKIAHHGAYGFWSADGVNNTTDHKFVMYMLPTDISDTLLDGSLSHTKDSSVSSASFNFQNINGKLLRRFRSLVAPNAKIELYFSIGDSEKLSMGKWFIDRVSTSMPGNDISVTARNAIGKLLKEQTFDEHNSFILPSLSENLKAILSYAGVEDFFVGDAGKTWRLSFEPSNTLIDGIEDIIKLFLNWKIDETTEGVIGIGNANDARFDQPSTYHFERDKNCWSYSTEYSDETTYSRLCVSCKEPERTMYIDLPPHKFWPMPAHRTLFVTVPDGTSESELLEYANNLAEAISISGRTETFAGRFMPQLIIGDGVELIADGDTESIGVITSIRHTFGRKGFYTEFSVDSGGRKGKPMLKDYVARITGNGTSSAILLEENGGISQ